MHCPSCQSEFREGFTRCRSCDVDLIDVPKRSGLPLDMKDKFNNRKWTNEPFVEFPVDICCNCGVTDGSVVVRAQDTRLTRYFGFFGIEYAANLPLPFCGNCSKTAKRRPAGLFHRLVFAALIAAILFFGIVVFGISSGNQDLLERAVAIALVGGAGLSTMWYLARRPRGNQTSFYQPVRIRGLRRARGETAVAELILAFTNESYLQRFIVRNFDLINQGRVIAQHEP